jgi:acyl-CoA-binding protein
MNLNEQFQAAVQQVNNLPAEAASPHMNELYGLYKQATEGDVNTKAHEVNPTGADEPSGPAGLSQAQWESWNHFKGLAEEDAKRQYVAKAAGIGSSKGGTAAAVRTDAQTNAPASGATSPAGNSTPSQQPNSGPGASQGGLRGDITAGAPYGGEDKLKGEQ